MLKLTASISTRTVFFLSLSLCKSKCPWRFYPSRIYFKGSFHLAVSTQNSSKLFIINNISELMMQIWEKAQSLSGNMFEGDKSYFIYQWKVRTSIKKNIFAEINSEGTCDTLFHLLFFVCFLSCFRQLLTFSTHLVCIISSL